MIIETEHENGLKLKGVGIPIKFSESKPDDPQPAPAVGQHSVQVLKEAGYSEAKIEELVGKGIVFTAMKS
jgi:formyl-CoA transferase